MQGQERKALQLSVAQILGGALASVSAAVVASVFGVAGTLIGAAITSVVATVGGAVYMHSIERARERVRWRRDPRTGAVTAEPIPAPSASASIGRAGRAPWGLVRWVGGASALVFLLAIGALTAVETVAQTPVARLFGRPAPAQSETTVGAVFRQVADEETGQSDGGGDEAEPTPEATPEATPGVTPTVPPTPKAPAGVPTATAPAAKPTPTKAAPAPTTTPPAKGGPTPKPAVKPTPTPSEDGAPDAGATPSAAP